MSNVNKVLYNVDQRSDTTDAEKSRARANIDAERYGLRGMCWAKWHKYWGVTPSSASNNPLETYQTISPAFADGFDSSGSTSETVRIAVNHSGIPDLVSLAIKTKVKWTYILQAKWVNNSSLWGATAKTRLLLSDDKNVTDYAYGAYPLEWACTVVGNGQYDPNSSDNPYRKILPDFFKFISDRSVLNDTRLDFELTVMWEKV